MSMNRRRVIESFVLAGLGLPALPSRADAGVVKIMVGFPPSGLPDMVARAVAVPLGRALGVPAVVENKPGANGRLAAQAVKNAAPDGHTLLVAPESAMVHLPHVYDNLGYDPFKDFTPVAQLVENDFAIAINPGIPAKNLREFAEWCRKNPARATFASPGQGSAPHFMAVVLAKALDIPFKHIPYRGSNFAVSDVAGGHVSAMFASSTFVATQHKAGTLRMLATTGRQRLPATPEVPTFGELGVPQLTIVEGTWLFAPAKTPAAMVDKLSDSAVAAVNSPDMQAVIKDQAFPAPLDHAQAAKRLREEFDQRGAAIRAAGFTVNG